MGDALRRWGAEGSGRSIFYSTEMGGEQLFNADICNSAREGSDITASWESILYELDVGAKYAHLAGPGYAHFAALARTLKHAFANAKRQD